MTGRFAPSPTGRMHLGNVYCAVLSWLSARQQGGRWLLRIEDLDPQRSRREYAGQMMDDLRWLGLEWDEEPVCQSERTDLYAEYFKRLSETAHVYPCYCRRADLLAAGAPHASDGMPIYPGTCRHLATAPTGRTPAWRVEVPDRSITFTDLYKGEVTRNLAHDVGDFIVRRSDGVYAYQLAVVVDDALTGVTEVVRGEDLLTSAAQQIFLYERLSLPCPTFGHVPLLCAADGRRLCKRDKDMDMECLRSRYTPAELLGIIAHKAGLQEDDTPITLEKLFRAPLQLTPKWGEDLNG
ncbi:MAG: tRNA glutamyl-Q(34) synthetase GluQRS [Bacteroidaceae bacterium]|nr:tRNA glutamyl-Q(34) synthetase GluQRS [Bacteroidaceae bacterium]